MTNPLQVLLLIDYRGCFYSTTRPKELSMDLDALVRAFAARGTELVIRRFADVDFREDDFRGRYVLYQSSEDSGGHYRDFIEDILLGISLAGGILIPDFAKFRAHENKVFMEILRSLSTSEDVRSCQATGFGTLEDFLDVVDRIDGPRVLKASSGSGSKGVRLARSNSDLRKVAKRLSRSLVPLDWLKDRVKGLIRPEHRSISHHRRKFIVQNFIAGLAEDYKVLAYHDRYYVLRRQIRDGDFRASGSGRFTWPETPPPGMLDFAEQVHESFAVPLSSLDLARSDSGYHLLEFQFVQFGPLTLEGSEFFFVREGNEWVRTNQPSVLEDEFARAITAFVGGQLD
jgi:hypothetical protein